MKHTPLKPIYTPLSEFDELEEKLRRFFKEHLYLPLLRELDIPKSILKNDLKLNALKDALFTGRITFNRGTFSGRFTSEISKELRTLGAEFNRKTGTYQIGLPSLPLEVRNLISATESKWTDQLKKIDQKLSSVLPDQLAAQFKCADLFDKTLWRTEKEFQKNIKKITIAPSLTPRTRQDIAKNWEENMELWIKNFTSKQIQELRAQVFQSAFKGNRYGSLAKVIQKSYGVSLDKAKFLARQETNLLMAQFKQSRYQEAGVHEYRWECVNRPHDKSPKQHTPGNVRYSHGILHKKIFRFDSPPITTNPGQPVRRNNPQQDYNCIPENEQVSLYSPTIKAFRRWYKGELTFIVTDSGETLRITRNHPVLTLRGWIPAHLIQMNDYLVKAPPESTQFSIGNPQSRNSLAGEIFSSFTQSGLSHRVSGRASWFHGDTTGENVDIVRINRKLFDNSISPFEKEVSNNFLTGTDSSTSRQSHFSQNNIGISHSSTGFISSFNKLHSISSRSISHSQIHGFSSISDIDIVAYQNSPNRRPTNFELFSDSLLAHSLLIYPNNFEFRKVKSVVSDSWSGFVYNFETLTGWYASNNLIVHNCRCIAIPLVRFDLKASK